MKLFMVREKGTVGAGHYIELAIAFRTATNYTAVLQLVTGFLSFTGVGTRSISAGEELQLNDGGLGVREEDSDFLFQIPRRAKE